MTAIPKKRRTVFRKKVFYTKYKTTTERGKKEYMRKYMKAYRDLSRKRAYSPRKKK